ncbi:MAG: SUMF1/EgtB/PvdO family nonheme iron enzyme [Bacteroidales bacterium]|nr:SUMF1/EgtB/PvdO family nonheme iron enzyme [Bacteroidales bacterium]
MKHFSTTLVSVALLLIAACSKPSPSPSDSSFPITWAPDATAAQRESIRQLAEDLVTVESGTFYMGVQSIFPSMPGFDSTTWYDQRPVHLVNLSPYMIGRYEVTRKQWFDIMGDGTGTDGHYTIQTATLPMSGITAEGVDTFLARIERLSGLHFRLPTEAEWEYAARGGGKGRESDRFSGAYFKEEVAWTSTNAGNEVHPVGQLAPNALGIYDMSGNVGELCSDIYAPYPAETQFDPIGPSHWEEDFRVVRGGNCYSNDQNCRVYYRSHDYPKREMYYTGLRVVMSPIPQQQ